MNKEQRKRVWNCSGEKDMTNSVGKLQKLRNFCEEKEIMTNSIGKREELLRRRIDDDEHCWKEIKIEELFRRERNNKKECLKVIVWFYVEQRSYLGIGLETSQKTS